MPASAIARSLAAVTLTKRAAAMVENLAKRKSGKPRTATALRTTIRALFANEGLTEGEVDQLIKQLIERAVIRISDGKVLYEVPA
jgi:hypothetical protein